jgi:hypothetical protein
MEHHSTLVAIFQMEYNISKFHMEGILWIKHQQQRFI